VEYFNLKAEISHLKKDNCLYMACPTAECNKKVIDQSNGDYRCEKCNKDYKDYKWRLMLQASVVDSTGEMWITCFQDTAEVVLGRKSDELGRLKQMDDQREFDELFAECMYKTVVMKVRAKMETFNDETRLKTICVQATPVNYKEYSQRLITELESMFASGL